MIKPNCHKVMMIGDGGLYIMPRPSPDWLAEDLAALKSDGIDHMVSLLEPHEAVEIGLAEEAVLCEQAGLIFTQFPIVDRGLPLNKKFRILVDDLHNALLLNQSIAIHCRAGIGRSGVLVCCILIKNGMTAEVAIECVAQARGLRVPDTDAQADYIYRFAQNDVS